MNSSDEIDVTTLFNAGSQNRENQGPLVAHMPVDKYSYEYNMNHKFRGKALIFNHEFFDLDFLKERKGTNVDRDSLMRTLKGLNFEVTDYNNFTTREIMDTLSKVAKEDHTDYDCICITVMSHGSTSFIFSKDTLYQHDSLWDHFTPDNCPTLAGKPKIFFIQACKGTGFDDGYTLPGTAITETDASSCESSYKIPTYADFIVAHSTIPGFVSWRDKDKGSWFIQSLCQELDEYGKKLDLLKLLTFVNQRVAVHYQTDSEFKQKQMPCISFMLTRLVYFTDKENK
ncbi:CASP7 family protein [Megaselia abdita]